MFRISGNLEKTIKRINETYYRFPTVVGMHRLIRERVDTVIDQLKKELKTHPPTAVKLIIHDGAPALELTASDKNHAESMRKKFAVAAFAVVKPKNKPHCIIIQSSFKHTMNHDGPTSHPGYTTAVTLAHFPDLLDLMKVPPHILKLFKTIYIPHWRKGDGTDLPQGEDESYDYLLAQALLDLITLKKTPPAASSVPPKKPSSPTANAPEKIIWSLQTALDSQVIMHQIILRQDKVHVAIKIKTIQAHERFVTALEKFNGALLASLKSKKIGNAEAIKIRNSIVALSTAIAEKTDIQKIAAAAEQFNTNTAALLALQNSNWPVIIGAVLGAVIGILIGSVVLGLGAPLGAIIGAYVGSTLGAAALGSKIGFWHSRTSNPVTQVLKATENICAADNLRFH